MFDSVAGLPVHPLVVHAAVVLLPLSAVAVLLVVFIRPLRERFAGLSVLGVLVATAATFVAKESGEALERHVGDPGQHAEYGDLATIGAVVLAVVTVAWYLVQRRRGTDGKAGLPATIAGMVAAVAAVASLGLVVLVGHSGAEQTWKGTVNRTAPGESGTNGEGSESGQGSESENSAEGAEPSATAGQSPAGTASAYTLQEVAQHADQTSCWAAVSGDVYDLTAWVARHPGGQQRILNLCGTDATQAFQGEHDGQREPQNALAEFKIGTLQG